MVFFYAKNLNFILPENISLPHSLLNLTSSVYALDINQSFSAYICSFVTDYALIKLGIFSRALRDNTETSAKYPAKKRSLFVSLFQI